MGGGRCIPQRNPTLKHLAISCIALYASACKYFIAIAPDATHADFGTPCNAATCAPPRPRPRPHSARAPSAGWVIWELRAETVRAGWRAQTAPLLHGLDGAVALTGA